MDLCADQLLAHLPPEITTCEVAPDFAHVFGFVPFSRRAGFNADRLLNRRVLLPRIVRRAARHADFVHVVDHSYAHLVNEVPSGRAGVYCHDLDAVCCLIEPAREPRPWWFRALARRTLNGLRRAAVVFHGTESVGREIRDRGLVPAERLVHAPYGVAVEFTPVAETSVQLPVEINMPFLLHVGSNIPRKRLDVLLEVFAEVRRRLSGVRLVQVGGPWPPHLTEQITRLQLSDSITQVKGLTRAQLAELYRKAAVVLVPSEAEGFGLPVIEALACGACVVASDIPAIREAGGDAAIYCPVADVSAWVRAAVGVLSRAPIVPPRNTRLSHAAKFSWRNHARIIADAYRSLREGE
jgi:glycosyltransferase involved in cell wall biosynthesis